MVKNKKIKLFGLFLIVLVIVLSFAVIIFKPSGEVIDEEERLKSRDLYEEFRESGVIWPRNRVEITSSFDGRIEKICVNEGDSVKKGQIVLWISSVERATMINAAMVAEGPENYKKWKNICKATPILAPMDGFIIHRNKEPKQTVSFKEEILVMADELIVYVNINEVDLKYVKIGTKLSMCLDAYPERIFEGIVEHISYESSVVNNVVLYGIKIRPVNKLKMVRSGMSVTVTIPVRSKKGVLSIPVNFVSEKGQKKVVTVKEENMGKPTFKTREVKTGVSDGRFIEIVSGLDIGEKVVTFKSKRESKTE